MVMIKRDGDLFVEKKWSQILEKESGHTTKGLNVGDDSAILEMFRRREEITNDII